QRAPSKDDCMLVVINAGQRGAPKENSSRIEGQSAQVKWRSGCLTSNCRVAVALLLQTIELPNAEPHAKSRDQQYSDRPENITRADFDGLVLHGGTIAPASTNS